MIKVLFFASIRERTREKETEVEDAPATMEALLRLLCPRYGPDFEAEVFDGDSLSSRLIILVNGRHIAHTGGPGTPLRDGDTVAVFPLIGGG